MANDADEYIYSIVDANNALSESFEKLNGQVIANINSSKTWTIVSRLTSGSGFWQIQNKLRAFTTAWVLYNKNQADAIEKQNEMTTAVRNYAKVLKALPDKGFSMYAGRNDTREIKNYREKVIQSDDFQNMQSMFQQRFESENFGLGRIRDRLRKGGAEEAANRKTLEFFDESIKLQQKQAKKQMILLRQQEKYQIPIYGRLVQLKDRLFTGIKLMPKFFFGGLRAISFLLKGATMAVLLLPIFVAVLRYLLKLSKNVKPSTIENLKIAFGFIKESLSHVGSLVSAIMAGQWKTAVGIWFKKILPPIFKAGMLLLIMAVYKIRDAVTWIWDNKGMIRAEITKLLRLVVDESVKAAGKMIGYFNVFNRNSGIRQMIRGVETSASGNVFPSGGLSIVGEGGPELVSLPRGAKVHSNFASRGMMRGMGNTIHVHVNGRVGASDSEIKDIAQKVAREINLQMNRSSSTVVRM